MATARATAPAIARRVGTGLTRSVDVALAHRKAALAVIVVGQMAATVGLAFSAAHNGWLYYQGGDQIWYGTTGWSLGDLRLPNALVGYGWSLVLAPVTWVTGPTFLQALPVIAVVDVLVVGSIAVICVYALAERVGGALLGLWAAALWVATPLLAIPFFVQDYHQKYVDQFLPQALGLTAMADYFSMVALLVAAVFVMRSVDRRSWTDAVVAGLVVGLAGGAKPPNYLFLGGAALVYVGCRRRREALAFGAAMAPAVLTLAIWKARGLGNIPLFSLGEVHEAIGSTPVAVQASVNRYVNLDWGSWTRNMSNLREFFYSARLAQWAPIAGAVAVSRRRPAVAALLVGWLAAFLVIKGMSPYASIEGNTFFRYVMPAWPAYLILFAAIPALIPTLLRRLGERARPAPPGPGLGLRATTAAAVVLALVPLLVVVASRGQESPKRVVLVLQDDGKTNILTPVDDAIRVRAVQRGEAVVLSWSVPSWRAGVSYRILRTTGDGPDSTCETAGVTTCLLQMETMKETRAHTYLDGSPPAGVTYRIGVMADYANPPLGGDMFAVSPPLRVAG